MADHGRKAALCIGTLPRERLCDYGNDTSELRGSNRQFPRFGTSRDGMDRHHQLAIVRVLLAVLVVVLGVAAATADEFGTSSPRTAAAQAPTPVANGGIILFLRDGMLYRIGPDGGGERPLAHTAYPLLPGHTIRGQTAILFAGSESPVQLLNVSTGAVVTLADTYASLPPGSELERQQYLGGSLMVTYGIGGWSRPPLMLSPDERWAVGVRVQAAARDVVLIDVQTGQVRRLASPAETIWLLRFLNGSRQVLLTLGDPRRDDPGRDLLIDVESGRTVELPSTSAPPPASYLAATSPDDTLLALSSRTDVRLIDLRNGSLLWARSLSDARWVGFSPDGARVLAVARSDCGHDLVGLAVAVSGTVLPLTCDDLGADTYPYVIGMDLLALARGALIFGMRVDTMRLFTNERRPLVHQMSAYVQAPADGRSWLVVEYGEDPGQRGRYFGRSSLYRPDGALAQVLAERPAQGGSNPDQFEGTGQAWLAPDGGSVVYECGPSRVPDLCLSRLEAPSAAPRILTSGTTPIWVRGD